MEEGWVKLHRKVLEHPMYYAEPFTRMQAWFDLLMLANIKNKVLFVRGNRVEIKRGMIANSRDWLAGRWRWSRGKVDRYLNMLENDGMIVQQKSRVITCISVVNFDYYQFGDTTESTTINTTNKASVGITESTTENTTKSTTDGATDGVPDKEQHKNIYTTTTKEKYKKEKNITFIPPSEKEVNEYIHENGLTIDASHFIDYYAAKGWTVGHQLIKDWKAAARIWDRKEKAKAAAEAKREAERQAREKERAEKLAQRPQIIIQKTSHGGDTIQTEAGQHDWRTHREREKAERDSRFANYLNQLAREAGTEGVGMPE